MSDRKRLEDVAVGDRVWVSDGHSNGAKSRMQTVARLTPTQIILDGYYSNGAASEFNRYQRGVRSRFGGDKTYRQIAFSSFASRILSIATFDECAQWDAKQAAKAEADAAFQRERKAIFADTVNVSETGESWDVTLYGLTEDQVKRLAALLKDFDLTAS